MLKGFWDMRQRHVTSNCLLSKYKKAEPEKTGSFHVGWYESREGKTCLTCIMCSSPGDQWPLWAGRCCLSSSRLSWFSENFSPLATDHPPSCASEECSVFSVQCSVFSVCTSQAHYNANDAATQWSFMSCLFTASNVYPLLHIFAFHTCIES